MRTSDVFPIELCALSKEDTKSLVARAFCSIESFVCFAVSLYARNDALASWMERAPFENIAEIRPPSRILLLSIPFSVRRYPCSLFNEDIRLLSCIKFGIALMLLIASDVFLISLRSFTIRAAEPSIESASFRNSFDGPFPSISPASRILEANLRSASVVLFTDASILINFLNMLSRSFDTLSLIPSENINSPKSPPAIFLPV